MAQKLLNKRSLLQASLLLLVLLFFHQSAQCNGANTKTQKKKKSSSTKKKKKSSFSSSIDTTKYADICVGTGTSKSPYTALTTRDKRQHAALSLLIDTSSLASIKAKDSPQHKAACWMLYDDPRKLDPRGKSKRYAFLQRYALLVLYQSTHGIKWKKSDGWLSGDHECSWLGISCYEYNPFYSGVIERIRLSFNDLNGLLPREMSLLQDMKELDLHGNDVQGVIPHMVLAGLKNLKVLKLHMNSMFGVLPKEIGKMASLQELVLFGNYFAGKIPPEIGQLKNLEVLDLYANFMTGQIPSQLAQSTSLKEIHLNDNNFAGKIPDSICGLTQLNTLVADCLGPDPEVSSKCATVCCRGLPDAKCVNVTKTTTTTTGGKKKSSTTSTTKKR